MIVWFVLYGFIFVWFFIQVEKIIPLFVLLFLMFQLGFFYLLAFVCPLISYH
jgi:hypothetical protein